MVHYASYGRKNILIYISNKVCWKLIGMSPEWHANEKAVLLLGTVRTALPKAEALFSLRYLENIIAFLS